MTNLTGLGQGGRSKHKPRAGAKVVTPEQMERSPLRAEGVRLKRENEILRKRWRTSSGRRCEVRLDGEAAHELRSRPGVCGPGGERAVVAHVLQTH